MHKSHVAKLVDALVQANGANELKFASGILVDLDDSALLLARAQYATIAAGAAPVIQPMIAIEEDGEAFSDDEGSGGDAEEREEATQQQQGDQSSGQEFALLESEMIEGMHDE